MKEEYNIPTPDEIRERRLNNADFTGLWIPKEIYLTDKLSSIDKIVLMEIDCLCVKAGKCWASNSYLGNMVGVSPSTITRSVKNLSSLGLITSTMRTIDKGTQRMLTSNKGVWSKCLDPSSQFDSQRITEPLRIKDYNKESLNKSSEYTIFNSCKRKGTMSSRYPFFTEFIERHDSFWSKAHHHKGLKNNTIIDYEDLIEGIHMEMEESSEPSATFDDWTNEFFRSQTGKNTDSHFPIFVRYCFSEQLETDYRCFDGTGKALTISEMKETLELLK